MCILFIYNGVNDDDSDYNLILVANRDEFYERPSQPMGPWTENSDVYGGRDLQSGSGCGTWMAINPKSKKLAMLLNLPGVKKNAKSRGKIVSDYVKSDYSINEYISYITSYAKECNDFILVSVEYGKSIPVINSYCTVTNVVDQWSETFLGFGNNIPNDPLKKVEVGREYLKNIVSQHNKVSSKSKLIDELIKFLKTTERHLPDPQLEARQRNIYEELSSIFVKIPKAKYGTRAHTIMLITKSGHVDVIEISMQSPIDGEAPHWERKEFKFND